MGGSSSNRPPLSRFGIFRNRGSVIGSGRTKRIWPAFECGRRARGEGLPRLQRDPGCGRFGIGCVPCGRRMGAVEPVDPSDVGLQPGRSRAQSPETWRRSPSGVDGADRSADRGRPDRAARGRRVVGAHSGEGSPGRADRGRRRIRRAADLGSKGLWPPDEVTPKRLAGLHAGGLSRDMPPLAGRTRSEVDLRQPRRQRAARMNVEQDLHRRLARSAGKAVEPQFHARVEREPHVLPRKVWRKGVEGFQPSEAREGSPGGEPPPLKASRRDGTRSSPTRRRPWRRCTGCCSSR